MTEYHRLSLKRLQANHCEHKREIVTNSIHNYVKLRISPEGRECPKIKDMAVERGVYAASLPDVKIHMCIGESVGVYIQMNACCIDEQILATFEMCVGINLTVTAGEKTVIYHWMQMNVM